MKKTLSILLAAILACSTMASASAATMASTSAATMTTESSESTTATMASTSDATMATESSVDMSFTVDEELTSCRTISFVIPEGAKPGDVFELILLDFDGKESLTVEEALESGKRISIVIPEGAKPGDILDLILPEPDDNGNLIVNEALDSDKIHFVDVPDDAEVGEDGYVVYGTYEGTTGEATAATEDEQVMTPSEDNADMSSTVDEALELVKTISIEIPEGAESVDYFQLIFLDNDSDRTLIKIPEGAKPGDSFMIIFLDYDSNGNIVPVNQLQVKVPDSAVNA